MRTALLRGACAAAACVFSGCVGPAQGTQGKREAVPMEQLTLQNILRWPSGKDYIEATARGPAPEGEKDPEKRRKVACETAVIEAQRKLIVELQPLVARDKIRDMLHRSEAGKPDYGYDDACTLTLRVAREALRPEEPLK